MANRTLAAFVAASFLCLQGLPSPALADNQMGYQMLTVDQASALPRNGGKLGLNVGRAQQINSGGMTFELLRVNEVGIGIAPIWWTIRRTGLGMTGLAKASSVSTKPSWRGSCGQN